MPGWETVKMRRRGGNGAVSLSQLLLSCLSVSVSQDTIGPDSNCVSLIAPLVLGDNWVVLSHCLVYCTSEPRLLREATPTEMPHREMAEG